MSEEVDASTARGDREEGGGEGTMGTMNDWQPIATAPKDGTEILCTWIYQLPDGKRYWVKVMHVLSWWPNWHDEGKGAWVLDGDFAVRFEPDGVHETPPTGNWDPTHWMPLPEPPKPG